MHACEIVALGLDEIPECECQWESEDEPRLSGRCDSSWTTSTEIDAQFQPVWAL